MAELLINLSLGHKDVKSKLIWTEECIGVNSNHDCLPILSLEPAKMNKMSS